MPFENHHSKHFFGTAGLCCAFWHLQVAAVQRRDYIPSRQLRCCMRVPSELESVLSWFLLGGTLLQQTLDDIATSKRKMARMNSVLSAVVVGCGVVVSYRFQLVFMLLYLSIKRAYDHGKLLPQQSYLSLLELLMGQTCLEIMLRQYGLLSRRRADRCHSLGRSPRHAEETCWFLWKMSSTRFIKSICRKIPTVII